MLGLVSGCISSRIRNNVHYFVRYIFPGGELFDRIVSKVVYNEKEARDLVSTLLQAVKYCHGRGIVHRDLKVSMHSHIAPSIISNGTMVSVLFLLVLLLLVL